MVQYLLTRGDMKKGVTSANVTPLSERNLPCSQFNCKDKFLSTLNLTKKLIFMKKKCKRGVLCGGAVLLSVICLFVLSCSQEQETVQTDSGNQFYDLVSIGSIDITPKSTKSSFTEEYNLSFSDENGDSMLEVGLSKSKDGKTYGCTVDSSSIDFYVVFDKNNIFYYQDKEGNMLQKCRLTLNPSSNEAKIDVLEIYDNELTTKAVAPQKETWNDCFSRRMGSSIGIIMTTTSAFFGPEATAGVAIGAALSCVVFKMEK